MGDAKILLTIVAALAFLGWSQSSGVWSAESRTKIQDKAPAGQDKVPQDAQADAKEREECARKIVKVAFAPQFTQFLTAAIKAAEAEQGGSVAKGFAAVMRKVMNVDDMTELVVPIYVKHYDLPTLKGMMEFYESPAGKAMVKQSPMVHMECNKVGNEWGLSKIAEAKALLKKMEEEDGEKK